MVLPWASVVYIVVHCAVEMNPCVHILRITATRSSAAWPQQPALRPMTVSPTPVATADATCNSSWRPCGHRAYIPTNTNRLTINMGLERPGVSPRPAQEPHGATSSTSHIWPQVESTATTGGSKKSQATESPLTSSAVSIQHSLRDLLLHVSGDIRVCFLTWAMGTGPLILLVLIPELYSTLYSMLYSRHV